MLPALNEISSRNTAGAENRPPDRDSCLRQGQGGAPHPPVTRHDRNSSSQMGVSPAARDVVSLETDRDAQRGLSLPIVIRVIRGKFDIPIPIRVYVRGRAGLRTRP